MTVSLPPTFPASSEWTQDYVGLPFAWNGADRSGVSCWGLVRLAYREIAGIELPAYDEVEAGVRDGAQDPAPYIATPRFRQIETTAIASGDVLHLWGYRDGRRSPTHCGIAVSRDLVLHAEEATGAVVSRLYDPRFFKRLIGAFRYV